jgi:hypothetical protein
MHANLGVLASLALVANAILIPPSMTVESLGDDLAMETLGINPFKRTVAVECPGCPKATQKDNSLSWTEQGGSTFLLDFEVGPREDTLDIDGAQLYPPTFGHLSEPFYVSQLTPSGEPLRLRVTGYMFHFSSAQTVSEDGNELLPMSFKITSIEEKPINPPTVTINLLKDASGRLMIASFQMNGMSSIDEEGDCEKWPLLCKWKAILVDKIEAAKKMGKERIEDVKKMGKGCHRYNSGPMTFGKPHHAPQPSNSDHYAKYHGGHAFGEPGRPQFPTVPHHHHGHHHHHRHHRKTLMVLRRIFFTILVPILIGVFAGVLTYLVGMALGCLVGVIVTKIRGRAAYEAVALDEEEEQPRGGKEVYSELPAYDAPPVYEEAAEKEVVDAARKV